jgi:predicted  nucleic acid-binding Zn-ribbon protein
MNRIPVILLALAGWLCAGPARAALTDPGQIQTEAYVNLVQADQSLDAGRLDEALSQYKTAREFYLQLAREFPGHDPRVIQYRKTYCDNQIADLERRQTGGLPDELPELPPEPAPAWTPPPAAPAARTAPPPPAAPAAAAGERAVEIDYLKSRIASLESELAEFETVQDELESLTAEFEQLRTALENANRQLAERAAGEQSALTELRADLAARDARIAALEKDAEAKKQLDQALNDMEAKVHELRTQHDRLNAEIKTLDRELDDAEERAEKAEAKLKQAEDKRKAAERDLKDAEARTRQAETDLKQALADRAGADPKPAASSPQLAAEKPAPAKREPKAEAKAPPAPKAQSAEPPPAAVASPVKATVPPQPIPAGMAAADFVRQLLQEGRNDDALATVQEARKKRQADMNLLLIEGIALIRLQRYPEAAALLIDLAKHNPRNAEIHATLGAAMMGAGFYEEARETLLVAVKLDKNLPECHYNLAQLYAFIDPVNLKLANRHYKQARDLGLAPDPQLEKALK